MQFQAFQIELDRQTYYYMLEVALAQLVAVRVPLAVGEVEVAVVVKTPQRTRILNSATRALLGQDLTVKQASQALHGLSKMSSKPIVP